MQQPKHEFFAGAAFDRFLLEPIGEDSNGMALTVLSALARLDLDPWEEAAALSRLPGGAATRKLAQLLAALPGKLLAGSDTGTLAPRLVSLLPVASTPRTPVRPLRAGAIDGGGTSRPPLLASLILYLMLMVLMFASEWLITQSHAPAVQAGVAPVAAAAASAPAAATGSEK